MSEEQILDLSSRKIGDLLDLFEYVPIAEILRDINNKNPDIQDERMKIEVMAYTCQLEKAANFQKVLITIMGISGEELQNLIKNIKDNPEKGEGILQDYFNDLEQRIRPHLPKAKSSSGRRIAFAMLAVLLMCAGPFFAHVLLPLSLSLTFAGLILTFVSIGYLIYKHSKGSNIEKTYYAGKQVIQDAIMESYRHNAVDSKPDVVASGNESQSSENRFDVEVRRKCSSTMFQPLDYDSVSREEEEIEDSTFTLCCVK